MASRCGLAVGALYGVADGLAVCVADGGRAGLGASAALVALDGLIAAGLGLVAGGLAGWLRRGPVAAGAVALGTVALAHALPLWFQPTVSFVAPQPLVGRPLPFLGLVVAAGLLLAGGARLLRDRPRLAWLGYGLALIARVGASVERSEAAVAPPADALSVLVVTIDTTRADHVGAWGSTTRTPNIDRLAAEGARLSTAIAQIPVTGPSHLSMFTGAGPWTHGNLLNGMPAPASLPLLAERLRGAGWRTGAFVSSFVLDGRFGLARGFQVYDDEFSALPGWTDTAPGRWVDRVATSLQPDREVERRADATVDRALAWLGAQGEAPLFVWVHLFDPHGPYHAPAPWDTAYYQGDPRDPANDSMSKVKNVASYLKPSLQGITDLDYVLAQYAGEVSYADQELGRILAWLDASGRAERTLVLVLGDHGESLGEHEVWFNHGDSLFEAEVHVPFVARLPGRIPAGAHVDEPVELTDVAPTALGLLGLPTDAPDGVDLGPWLRGESSAPPRPFARSIAWDRPANLAARQAGTHTQPTWRVVALRAPAGRYVLREAEGEQGAWYDRATDPQEITPLEPPEAVAGLLRESARALLERHRTGGDGGGATGAAAEPAMDDETREKLEALGYIEE